ncbi:hypothetical protein fugu_019101 [Takifugu bimaculatus]|uniref:Homeobox domain-containing protein n=1 Tax=Takifugu bimaculatus TaxID=433685 RepID=A0A4Z2BJC6_9TELE|nr:hypothetical protein fugu_019101 [Takifugu bimaculatus]
MVDKHLPAPSVTQSVKASSPVPLIPISPIKGSCCFDGASGTGPGGRAGAATPLIKVGGKGSRHATEVGFGSGTEEETSGYESEGDHSLSPSAPAESSTASPPPSPPSGRRPRTAFTAEQICSMERAFKRNAYLGTQDKAELCKKLNLSDKQIRNWFQNRRMKLKRTMQDALAHACQANAVPQLLHYPELQAYRPGPYPRFTPAAAVTAPEGSAAASFIHPHSLQYSPALPSVPTLALDSYYQYSSIPWSRAAPSNHATDGLLPNLPVLLTSLRVHIYHLLYA